MNENLKFDPKTLKHFDKVLVRHLHTEWTCAFLSHIKYVDDKLRFVTTNGPYEYCVPYNDDTKHLVDTSNSAPKYYRCWNEDEKMRRISMKYELIYRAIGKAIKEVFDMDIESVFATRLRAKREITDIRLMSMKVIHDESLLDYKDIGNMFSRTKSGVRCNIINATNYICTDLIFRNDYNRLKTAYIKFIHEAKSKQNR